MNKTPVIAIIDVGKTNKKCFFLDEGYAIRHEQSEVFAETRDEDGDPCENLDQLTAWIKEVLHGVAAKAYDIRAVNFSAYGASLVYLDEQGKPLAPLYNYLKPYPPGLSGEFYQTYGGEENFSVLTASPVLGSLNAGLQLYRLKKLQPEKFKRTKYALHLPQFLSYLLTGKFFSEICSIGCHTGLWNFSTGQYHEWVDRERVAEKLAPLFPASFALASTLAGRPVLAGIGLHDSSAALIPFLQLFPEPFVLLSTGTWCISLNPFNQDPLTADELRQDCLCYLSYKGNPVKASRLFAGHRHEQETKKLAAFYQVAEDHYKTVGYQPEILKKTRTGTAGGSGPSNYDEAYHRLMTNLISEQVQSTRLVLDGTRSKRIFVDGGFAGNRVYMHLLAAAFPDLAVYAAAVPQATALGAALAIHDSWNPGPIPEDLVELKLYPPS